MAGRYGLEIRAASPADAPGLAELFGAVGAPIDPRRLAERLEALSREPGAVLIAGEWGPPTGVVALHWRRSLRADAPTARLDILLVAPEDRRRGVGRLLLKAAAQAARQAGCGELQLSVAPDQATLRSFAEATGFTSDVVGLTRSLRKQPRGDR